MIWDWDLWPLMVSTGPTSVETAAIVAAIARFQRVWNDSLADAAPMVRTLSAVLGHKKTPSGPATQFHRT